MHDLSGALSLYSRLLGAEGVARVMLLKDLWEESPLVAFGLDYPSTGMPFPQISPLHGIEISCTQRAPGATKGRPLPPANQRLTLANMLADLVVVERDLFQEPPHRIHAVSVVFTCGRAHCLWGQGSNRRRILALLLGQAASLCFQSP